MPQNRWKALKRLVVLPYLQKLNRRTTGRGAFSCALFKPNDFCKSRLKTILLNLKFNTGLVGYMTGTCRELVGSLSGEIGKSQV